jgi:hypothetical protein
VLAVVRTYSSIEDVHYTEGAPIKHHTAITVTNRAPQGRAWGEWYNGISVKVMHDVPAEPYEAIGVQSFVSLGLRYRLAF